MDAGRSARLAQGSLAWRAAKKRSVIEERIGGTFSKLITLCGDGSVYAEWRATRDPDGKTDHDYKLSNAFEPVPYHFW